MKIAPHSGISLAVSAATYAVSRSVEMTAASFLAGIFIDLDHLFDYVREYGLRPDLRFFFHICEKTLFKRTVLFLHSWELCILLAGALFVTHGNSLVIGLLIGMTQHLLLDQVSNRIKPKGYWLLFRLRHRFLASEIFTVL